MKNETLLIRFSDYLPQINTIKEHQKIIQKHKKVYWGWWQKYFETLPKNINTPVNVWIVDRWGKNYYKARMKNIFINKNKTASPDKLLTPSYYSDECFKVWFEFSSIKKVNPTVFNTLYKMPIGNGTLFQLKDIHGHEQANYIKTEGNSILHISDLHFGKFHGYYCKENPFGKDNLLDQIKQLLKNQEIGVIVASGDFTSSCSSQPYEEARKFLEELCEICKIKNDALLIIPGNHDRNIKKNKTNPKMGGTIDSKYRKFRKELLGIPENEDLHYLKHYELKSGWKLSFSCFNSGRIKDERYKEYGFIGDDIYLPLLREQYNLIGCRTHLECKNNKIINFCVVHHHVKMFMQYEASIDKPVSVLIDAGDFEKALLDNSVHFLIHGHLHVPYCNSFLGILDKDGKDRKLNILSAGSISAKIGIFNGEFNECPYNSFNIYTPEEGDFMRVITYSYNTKDFIEENEQLVPYV